MKRSSATALIVAGLLLCSAPSARADFFDDLDFALNKLGTGVADTVNDLVASPTTSGQSNKSVAPPSQTAPANQRAGLVMAKPVPSKTGSKSPVFVIDDAPPPRAAPHRDPVERVGLLGAPSALQEAPPAYNPLTVSKITPVPASAFAKAPYPKPRPTSLNAQQLARIAPFIAPEFLSPTAAVATTTPAQKPAQKSELVAQTMAQPTPPQPTPQVPQASIAPAAGRPSVATPSAAVVQPQAASVTPILLKTNSAPRSFAVRFSGLSTVISDDLTTAQEQPQALRTLVISAAGKVLATDKARVMLVASAYSMPGEPSVVTSSRAFERAQAVRDWLVNSGIRPTQVDFTIVAPNQETGPADKVDIIVSSDTNVQSN